MSKIFDTQNSVCSDECWKKAKDNYNDEISGYYTYNNNFVKCEEPNVRMPSSYLEHENLRGRPGYGLSDPCLIDIYNNLVKNNELMTHDRCKIQIYERLFSACPSFKNTGGDINKELDIIAGTDTNPYRCKKTIMEQSTYKFIPMIDCVKEVQNPDHIVPNWIRGGEDTRSYINRVNFNKKQC